MKSILIILFFEIKSAIFYPQGVKVIDERVYKLKKGLNQVEIFLNPFVLETSIRAKIEGGKIIGLDIKREKFDKPVNPLKFLQDSLDKLLSIKNFYENEKKGIENAIEFLKSFRVAYSEKISKEYLEKPFEYQKLSQTIDYLLKENKELGKNFIEIEKKIGILNKDIEIVKNKINELKPVGEEGIIIKIDLNSFSEDIKIILEYIIKERCGWNSFYELNAFPEENKVKITGWARVYQFLGDDFKNIRLTLSTGMPHLRIEPPEITVWEIFPSIPKPIFGEEMRLEKRPMEFLPAEKEEKFLTLHYEIKDFVDIPSRKEPVPIVYIEEDLPARFLYYTYPRFDEKVYFQCKIFNRSNNLFIGGETNLYVEEEFRGKGYLNNFVPNDSIEVYFGEDPEIKVKREKKIYEVYKKGLIKKEIVHHFGYETRIKNFRKREIEIILIEQVPVSNRPEIRVENIKFSHKPVEVEEIRGVYKFKINLKPKEEFKLNFEFDIISEKEDLIIPLF